MSQVRQREHTSVRRRQRAESESRWLALRKRLLRPRKREGRIWKRPEGCNMSLDLDDIDFGTSKCVCPKCGNEIPHAKRGVPCSQIKCPSCGEAMMGRKCRGEED